MERTLRWRVEVGAARQLRQDAPLAGGVLAACALVWAALALLSMFEMSEDALGFSTRMMLVIALALEVALVCARVMACAWRGRLTLEYALGEGELSLNERARRARHCALRLDRVDALKRTRDGMVLRSGRLKLSVLCTPDMCAAIAQEVDRARNTCA